MHPLIYVIAIMGCSDGGQACQQQRVEPIHYVTPAACQAAMPDALQRNNDRASARVAGSESFATLARRIQQDANAAEPFHHVPLSDMQRLGGQRRTLFDHVLVFENYPFASAQADGLKIGQVRAIEQMHFDYSLVVHPGDELEIKFSYNSHAIDAAEFERIEAQWRGLVDAVLADPDRPLREIDFGGPALPAPEQAIIAGTVLDLFEARVAERPDAIAVEQGEHRISYRELDERARTLARTLAALGVTAGDRVISFQPHGIGHVATLLAAWKMSAILVPLDTEAPARRLKRLVERIGAPACIAAPCLHGRLAEAIDMPPERLLVWNKDGSLDGARQGPEPTAPPTAADPG